VKLPQLRRLRAQTTSSGGQAGSVCRGPSHSLPAGCWPPQRAWGGERSVRLALAQASQGGSCRPAAKLPKPPLTWRPSAARVAPPASRHRSRFSRRRRGRRHNSAARTSSLHSRRWGGARGTALCVCVCVFGGGRGKGGIRPYQVAIQAPWSAVAGSCRGEGQLAVRAGWHPERSNRTTATALAVLGQAGSPDAQAPQVHILQLGEAVQVLQPRIRHLQDTAHAAHTATPIMVGSSSALQPWAAQRPGSCPAASKAGRGTWLRRRRGNHPRRLRGRRRASWAARLACVQARLRRRRRVKPASTRVSPSPRALHQPASSSSSRHSPASGARLQPGPQQAAPVRYY
jgi:hypothetical protein